MDEEELQNQNGERDTIVRHTTTYKWCSEEIFTGPPARNGECYHPSNARARDACRTMDSVGRREPMSNAAVERRGVGLAVVSARMRGMGSSAAARNPQKRSRSKWSVTGKETAGCRRVACHAAERWFACHSNARQTKACSLAGRFACNCRWR